MTVIPPAATESLSTEAIHFAGLSELDATKDPDERAAILAKVILAVFDDYYLRSRRIGFIAKDAFERLDWPAMLELSRDRLAIYGVSVTKLSGLLRNGCPELLTDSGLWTAIETHFVERIRGRYEADLAFAFVHSVRRGVFQDEWQPVAYSYGNASDRRRPAGSVLVTIPATAPISSDVVRKLFDVPGFTVPWRDIADDADLVAAELNRVLGRFNLPPGSELKIIVANTGFYRNRGAYLIGRISIPGHGILPLLVALLNDRSGIFVDAVLTESDELQYVFSSTLANFHVTNPHYHELVQLLFSVMPKRPLGTHYSTIGFNHVGKVAVIGELGREHARSGERLDIAVGFRGTVAIGFSMPSSRYVLKIIRDKPTSGYKWGTFPGVEAVLDKYRLVHDIDRAGSMLDNIIYTNVIIDRSWFAPGLIEELVEHAPSCVSARDDGVLFKHLIAQMKMIPLPVFLATASPEEARAAVINLGDCIKNNAAANIFNKDLDGRNYGVSRILKVYLFDYDAVEPLTDIKVRTNTTREEGEEDPPDWFFEDGTIFLPEETMAGLRIDDRELRRLFRDTHSELMDVGYWEGMQRALRDGKVPKVRSYPEWRRLRRPSSR